MPRDARNFSIDAPNKVWMGDITYIATLAGRMYLAVVLDLYSRKVVGWALASHMRDGRQWPSPGLVGPSRPERRRVGGRIAAVIRDWLVTEEHLSLVGLFGGRTAHAWSDLERLTLVANGLRFEGGRRVPRLAILLRFRGRRRRVMLQDGSEAFIAGAQAVLQRAHAMRVKIEHGASSPGHAYWSERLNLEL